MLTKSLIHLFEDLNASYKILYILTSRLLKKLFLSEKVQDLKITQALWNAYIR